MMSFGLKNVGATYQQTITKVFEEQLRRNIQVYVDDMTVKRKRSVDHIRDLAKTLNTLRRHGMKLNPKKCVFGVKGGKCLGFLVDERGIEAIPDKINAILNMPSPRNVKEVKRLTWCLVVLGRFLSCSADKSLLFFRVLKRNEFDWITRRSNLSNSRNNTWRPYPSSYPPCRGKTLYIYLSVSEYALSFVLVAEREETQHPVYFINHAY